ncbi:hypothetical protein AX15_004717 [Amanita polypyramis BW_CC]|nr:hypothetical protein AX15_004717 [Amanita polypyramis BW_CC]
MSVDLTLDRVQRLVPHLATYTRPTIHVAGTNGKGSVSAYLSYILASSQPPLKVGRYNSPHLLVPRDCITIDNVVVSEDVYATVRSVIDEADGKHGTGLSSFELLTLTAFLIFEEAKVDIAVVEVGMGGRLDATNILPTSVILSSALTSVGLDHQAFLGPTVAHIANEKASIARPGRPFIVGKQRYEEVHRTVEDIVARVGAISLPAIVVSHRDWCTRLDGQYYPFSLNPEGLAKMPPQPISCQLPCFNETLNALLPLFGDHQLDNLGIALGVISSLFTHAPEELVSQLNLRPRLTLQTISEGIQGTLWPGRLSFHTISIPPLYASLESQKSVILVDGAHNLASTQALSDYLTHLVSILSPTPKCLRITYILALSHSPPKTPMQTLSPLFPFAPSVSSTGDQANVTMRAALVRFTPPEGMPWVNSIAPSELREVVSTLAPGIEVWLASDSAKASSGEPRNEDLVEALKWAVSNAPDGKGNSGNLVVVAGSLYLVADFYRARRKLR